jgi:hypothetical protein
LPWVGNLHQIDPKRLHTQLEAWCHALGPTYTFKLGPKRILVTSDIEIALSALKDRPGRFRRLSTIEPVAREMGTNGVFSVEGEAWRPQRDLVMRALDRLAVVELIGATTTKTGLKVDCRSTRAPTKRASNAEMKALNITGDRFHPEWNYKITPRQQPP